MEQFDVSDVTGGRDIAGIETRQQSFSHLEEGRDYEITQLNKLVSASKTPEDLMVFVNEDEGESKLDVKAPHWRTVTQLGVESHVSMNVIEHGELVEKKFPFYEVNIKGVGYLKPGATGKKLNDYDTWLLPVEHEWHDYGYKTLGLSSMDEFRMPDTASVVTESNYFLEQGLRTEVHWAVAKLKQLYYKGKLTPVEELRKNGVILARNDYVPAIDVRILKTNDRIAEAAESDERRDAIFRNAFEIYNREAREMQSGDQEIRYENPDDQRRFFVEFAQRMGSNMAVLLNTGHIYFEMHSSNITLAAELADIGVLRPNDYFEKNKDDPESEKYVKMFDGLKRGHIKDIRDMAYDLKILRKAGKRAGLNVPRGADVAAAFIRGFLEKADDEMMLRSGVDAGAARRWVEKISNTVLRDGIRLPALKHSEVTDWGI